MVLNNPSNQTISQYALQVGAANNLLGGIAAVATGQVLVSGGVSANPAYTAYPQISGLGIGASPGSTAGITFDGTNFMNVYASGSYTPVLTFGGGSTGITYTSQSGRYIKSGVLVCAGFNIVLSNKGSSTGTAEITLPFNAIAYSFYGSILFANVTFSAYPVSIWLPSSSPGVVRIPYTAGSGAGNNVFLDTNFTNTSQITGTITYIAST